MDSSYPCTGGFLPLCRGERYHAQEFHGQGRQARITQELFNFRYSSLRMTIERCFRVSKARLPILKRMPPYKPFRQRLIVISYYAFHNYVRRWGMCDRLFREWKNMDPSEIET